ncbi:uncharacterized protein LOC143614638 [Bidens hawaiensis]|uniref:uncharacterized protein LOC143614638 n=1 Tax=Bidens hawaiensis TaxID=980011 RepID=UPI004049595A
MVDTTWAWSRINLSENMLLDLADLHKMVVSYNFHTGKGDSWRWTRDNSGFFTVHGLRRMMADSLFGEVSVLDYLWDSWIPIRINCFMWRLMQHRIPVAANLIARGMGSIPSDCLGCVLEAESVEHVFLICHRAKDIWRAVSLWIGCDVTGFKSFLQLVQVADEPYTVSGRRVLKAIILVLLWFIWKQRNARTFRHRSLSTEALMEEIMINLYVWIKNRSTCKEIVWLDWNKSPIYVMG